MFLVVAGLLFAPYRWAAVIPYADTWDRSGDQKWRWFQDQIIGDLAERRVPFFRVRGTIDERVSQVDAVLRQYRKFRNVLDIRPGGVSE